MVGLVGVYSLAKMNQVIVAYHVRAEGEIELGEELAAYKSVPIDRLKPWPRNRVGCEGLLAARI